MPCPLNEFSWTCFPRGKIRSSGGQWPCGKDLFFEGSSTSVIRWGSGSDHPHSLPSKWRLNDSTHSKYHLPGDFQELWSAASQTNKDVSFWCCTLETSLSLHSFWDVPCPRHVTCFSICSLSFCGRTNHWEISEEGFATVSGVFLVHSMLKEVFEVRDQENDTWMFLFSSSCASLFTMLSLPYLAKGSALNSVLWSSGYFSFRPWGGTCRLL